ncbi:hypothetical protein BE21_57525 [Sorangium cellulosum]|uniref:Uncharacterized protein n=1 Tax=Sorangium cellulosum TaxID=56 RepID=A0A150U385_SORCE|nr:hypothetical protein BE21_57525 [Sorangium cellulosum]
MLTVDWLADRVREDFTARGVEAEVVYGSEKDVRNTASRRVAIGLDTSFTLSDPEGPQTPGPFVHEGEGDDEDIVARSIATRFQSVTAWIRGFPDQSAAPSDRALSAHTDAARLLHSTVAALYRVAHGSIRLGGGEWVRPERSEFEYGSLVLLTLEIGIPVLDLPLGRVTVQPANLAFEAAICEPSGCQTDVSYDPG